MAWSGDWAEGLQTGAYHNKATRKTRRNPKRAQHHSKTPRVGIRARRMAKRRA